MNERDWDEADASDALPNDGELGPPGWFVLSMAAVAAAAFVAIRRWGQ